MKKFTRRKVLKTLGAAAALPIAAPYLNLAHAQGATIPIGAGLPMTGNAGALELTGPQAGAASQRAPVASSHEASAPQNPRPAEYRSSFV